MANSPYPFTPHDPRGVMDRIGDAVEPAVLGVAQGASRGLRSLGNDILGTAGQMAENTETYIATNIGAGGRNLARNVAAATGSLPSDINNEGPMQFAYDTPRQMDRLPGSSYDAAAEAKASNSVAGFANDRVAAIKARDAGKAMLDEAEAMGKASQAGQWQAPQYTDARNPDTSPPLNTAATRAQSLYDRNPAGMHAQMFPTQAPILSHAGSPTTTHFGEGMHGMGASQGPQAPTVVGHAPVTQQTPMGRVNSHFMGQAPSSLRPKMSRMIADHSRMGMSAKTTKKFV